jgi:hypothetical protein
VTVRNEVSDMDVVSIEVRGVVVVANVVAAGAAAVVIALTVKVASPVNQDPAGLGAMSIKIVLVACRHICDYEGPDRFAFRHSGRGHDVAYGVTVYLHRLTLDPTYDVGPRAARTHNSTRTASTSQHPENGPGCPERRA